MRARGAGTQWRVAARLARREVRRRPWRTALVLLLIGVPVAGMTLYAIGARTTTPTLEERRTWRIGQADDSVHVYSASAAAGDPAVFDAALARAYPPGSRFVTFAETPDAATRTDGHLEWVTLTNRPLDDPLLAGTMVLVAGRAPRDQGEVAISRSLAEETDGEVGSSVDLVLVGRKTVAGIVVDPSCAASCPTAITTDPLTHRRPEARHAVVDAPDGFVAANWGPLYEIDAKADVNPDGSFNHWGATDLFVAQGAIYLYGVVVLAVVSVITIAAFAVAAQRQLRTLGLLSASGVPPTGLRRVVLLQGVTSGVLASGLGVGLGLALARALLPLFDNVSERWVEGLDFHPLDLVGPFVLGVVAATIAAWQPARTAARIPTLAALGGRQAQDRAPARFPLIGAVSIAFGIAALAWLLRSTGGQNRGLYGAGAAVALLVGSAACGPWLVSHTEWLSRRLRGGSRVALRDLARQRVRSGAVVAAIMAPAGVLALVATTSATEEARDRAAQQGMVEDPTSNDYQVQDNQVLMSPPSGWATGQRPPAAQIDELVGIVPDAVQQDIHVVLAQQPTSTGFPGATLRVVDPATGQAIVQGTDGAGRYLVTVDPAGLAEAGRNAELVAALEQGKIVVNGVPFGNPQFVLDGVTAPVDTVRDVVVLDDTTSPNGDTIAAISPATAAAWGAPTIYYGTLYEAPAPLTESQRDRISALTGTGACATSEDPDSCRDANIVRDLNNPPQDASAIWYPMLSPRAVRVEFAVEVNRLVRYGYAGVLLVFTLLVLAIALALSAAESRDERALLDAVGAPPSVRRSILAWQAGALPAIAIAVAFPAGVVVARAVDSGGWAYADPFVVPWLELAVGALGIPLAAFAVTWLVTSVANLRRRDLSRPALAAD